MNKKRVVVRSLEQIDAANGNWRLNGQYWISPIDYARMCSAADLSPETSALVFKGATITMYEVEVTAAGLDVLNPETGRTIKFKPNDKLDKPVMRYIAWTLQDLAPEKEALIIQNSIVSKKRISSTPIAKAVDAAELEVLADEPEHEEEEAEDEKEEPVANANDGEKA